MSANRFDRIRWRLVAMARVRQTYWKSVRERLEKYTAKEGVENVGKRTRSDPMAPVCRDNSPLHQPSVSSQGT